MGKHHHPAKSDAPAPAAVAAAVAAAASAFNPESKWQEHVEVPGLTLFDIHRQPRREAAAPDARVRMQLKVLVDEFHCPVCLGYIKNTRIVKECMHRFCDECIEKCLRIGKKECPQCRIHIPSRRSLRPDTNFDELMKSIYGDVNTLEKDEEEEVARMKEKSLHSAYAESRKRGILQQAEQRRKKAAIAPGVAGSSSHAVTPQSSAKRVIGLKECPLIDFVLRRHPQEREVERLKREHLRTSKDITVENIKEFLGKKLGYIPHSHFQILALVDENPVVLPSDITLALVRRDICDNPEEEIVLQYRISPPPAPDYKPTIETDLRNFVNSL